jgi:hypothetical protein
MQGSELLLVFEDSEEGSAAPGPLPAADSAEAGGDSEEPAQEEETEEENEEEEWVLVGNVGLDELLEGEDSEVLEKCV